MRANEAWATPLSKELRHAGAAVAQAVAHQLGALDAGARLGIFAPPVLEVDAVAAHEQPAEDRGPVRRENSLREWTRQHRFRQAPPR